MMNIYCIGVGGIGLSALARYYQNEGHFVSGSDAVLSIITTELQREGIVVTIGHSKKNLPEALDFVVYSSAVSETNEELKEVRMRGCRVLSYAEALGEITKKKKTITVSGSHGKSTTTSMLAIILIDQGIDPTVIVGTRIKEFGSSDGEVGGNNFRAGMSDWLVLEADEWNKSFLHYTPHIAVVTNIDTEHLDTYGSYEGVFEAFRQYLNKLPVDGIAVLNASDSGLLKIGKELHCKVIWYNGAPFAPHILQIPGKHNQENAEAAFRASLLFNINERRAEESLSRFSGAWRRFERLNFLNPEVKAAVYSDYAHHPTEIRATISGAREKYPRGRIVILFEPHQQDRFNQLFENFVTVFEGADEIFLLPVYQVLGREKEVNGKNVSDLTARIGENAHSLGSFEKTWSSIEPLLTDSTVVLIGMSAGPLDQLLRNALKN